MSTTDIDDRLRDYASRWQSAQPAPIDVDTALNRPARRQRSLAVRPVAALAVAVALVVVVIGVTALVGGSGGSRLNVGGLPGDGQAPVATPPLLPHLPPATDWVTLSTGVAKGVPWTLAAKIVASGPDAGLSLQLGNRTGSSGSGLAADSPDLEVTTLAVQPANSGVQIRFVVGVTSVATKAFRISYASSPNQTVAAVSRAPLRGLWFFAVQAEAAPTQIVALAGNGKPVVRADPSTLAGLAMDYRIPDVSSPAVAPPPPGTYPVWPVDNPPPASRSSALAVARDFSTRALGVTGNTITPDSHANGPTGVVINLPANHSEVHVVAEPGPGGAWSILQVGDLGGVSMYTNGRPSNPTIRLRPPAGTTSATITEIASDGIHHLAVGPAELQSGSATLAAGAVRSVLVVYANATGAPLGADGGEF